MKTAHDIADAALAAMPARLAQKRAAELTTAHAALAQKIEDFGAEEGDIERLRILAQDAYNAREHAAHSDHSTHRY